MCARAITERRESAGGGAGALLMVQQTAARTPCLFSWAATPQPGTQGFYHPASRKRSATFRYSREFRPGRSSQSAVIQEFADLFSSNFNCVISKERERENSRMNFQWSKGVTLKSTLHGSHHGSNPTPSSCWQGREIPLKPISKSLKAYSHCREFKVSRTLSDFQVYFFLHALANFFNFQSAVKPFWNLAQTHV